jgi:5'-nucleotidase
VDISGDAAGSVDLASGAYPAALVPTYSPSGSWSATGTYTAGSGTSTLALKLLKLDDSSFFNADTYCADAPDDADFKATGGSVSATITEDVASKTAWSTGIRSGGTTAVPAATPLALRVGDAIDLSGDDSWAAGSPLYFTVCSTDDTTACAPPAVANTVFGQNGEDDVPVVDGSGQVTSGSLRLGAIQAPGLAYVQLWQGTVIPPGFGRVVTKYANIPVRLLGDRLVEATTDTVLEGNTLSVTGSGWYPGETVTITAGTSSLGTVVASATGEIAASGIVTDKTATSVLATGIGGTDSDPITVTPIANVLTGTYALAPTSLWATQSAKVTPSAVGGAVASVKVSWGDGSALQTVSKTAATTHTFSKAGSFAVKATFTHANGRSVVKNLGTVVVRLDTVKPTAVLTLPAKSKRPAVASWKTLRGTSADTGLGAKSVVVFLTEKRGTAHYYYTGSAWKKAASATQAKNKAKRITVTVSAGKWSLAVKKLVKGTLSVSYQAVDKAGNKSAIKAYSQKLTR